MSEGKNTIHASELRVGNFLKADNTMKVIGLMFRYGSDDYKVWVQRVGSLLIYEFDEKDLEPLPLSPEILEKCGFVGDKLGIFEFLHKSDLIIRGDSYDYNGYYLGRVEYLHQLQNLFWCLVGRELEVNL